MALPENVAEARKSRGITQAELAEQIGVTQGMVSKMERGVKLPTVAILEQLADVLDVSVDWLLGRKESGNNG